MISECSDKISREIVHVIVFTNVTLFMLTLQKLYAQMDQKYGKNVYLRKTYLRDNRFFFRNKKNKQTFLTQYFIWQLI